MSIVSLAENNKPKVSLSAKELSRPLAAALVHFEDAVRLQANDWCGDRASFDELDANVKKTRTELIAAVCDLVKRAVQAAT